MDSEKIYRDIPIPPRTAGREHVDTDASPSRAGQSVRREISFDRPQTGTDRFRIDFEPPRREQEEIPARIRELKRMTEPQDGFYRPRAEAFYEQAIFMKDYEDHYEFGGPFFHYYPTYQDMNTREMRGYFSWRTAFRQGRCDPAPLSFLFVYVYEIINGIGFDEPEEGFQILQTLKEAYGQKEPSLLRYLSAWMQDYVVYWNLDDRYLDECFAEEKELDQKLFVLENYREQPEEEVFQAFCALSSHRAERSPVLKKAPDDFASAAARVYAAISDYSEKHHHGSLVERGVGRRDTRPFKMFHASVFFDSKKYDSLIRVIDPVRRYECRDGRWSCTCYEADPAKPKSALFGEILQETDRVLREMLDIKPALTEKMYRAAFKKIIAQTIREYLKEKEEAKKPVIHIDRSMLSGIRRDAEETRDWLLTEEESGETLRLPERENDFESIPGFERDETEFLHLLLDGKDIQEFVRERHLMLSVLVDSVNEKLYDAIGDTVLEMNGDEPEILPDYLEDLKDLMGQ